MQTKLYEFTTKNRIRIEYKIDVDKLKEYCKDNKIDFVTYERCYPLNIFEKTEISIYAPAPIFFNSSSLVINTSYIDKITILKLACIIHGYSEFECYNFLSKFKSISNMEIKHLIYQMLFYVENWTFKNGR